MLRLRFIVACNSTHVRKTQQYVQHGIVNELGAIRFHYENDGTYVGYTKHQQHVRTGSNQQMCSMHAIEETGLPPWE